MIGNSFLATFVCSADVAFLWLLFCHENSKASFLVLIYWHPLLALCMLTSQLSRFSFTDMIHPKRNGWIKNKKNTYLHKNIPLQKKENKSFGNIYFKNIGNTVFEVSFPPSLSPPALLMYNLHLMCMLLRHTTWYFDICIHCEIIVTIKLINISVTSYSYHFVWGGRTIKSYSLCKFKYTNYY